MPRQQRSEKAVADIAERFVGAIQDHLGMAPADLWRLLGYANPSTLQSVRKGKALPDFVRIAEHKSQLRDTHGRTLNLHWVITGEGQPLLRQGSDSHQKVKLSDKLDNDIIMRLRRMKPGKKAALVKFLSEFS